MVAAHADATLLASFAGFTPDPWQAAFLASAAQTRLLCCGRQTGKSTVTALLIVQALLAPDTLIVIITPSERQSKELMRKVLRFWRQIGRPLAHTSLTKVSLELENGARIEAFPASSETIIGLSAVNLLVADEAAVVPDELYHYVSPMLAVSDGRLVGLSTPKGKRGWWYELWGAATEDEADIACFEARSADCPRIKPAFLARERRRWGAWWYDQEYDCVFQEPETAAFRSEDIEAAFTSVVGFDYDLFAP